MGLSGIGSSEAMTGAEAMAASDALGEILKQPVLLAGVDKNG